MWPTGGAEAMAPVVILSEAKDLAEIMVAH
jgi:hypothetical protein